MAEPWFWPAGITPRDPQWWIDPLETRMRSWTGIEVAYFNIPGGIWRCRLGLPPMAHETAARFQAFLAGLRGTQRMNIPRHGYKGPYGSAGGTLLASGNANAEQVTITGCTGVNPWLKMGSLICINGERTHLVVENDVSRSGGTAVVRIAPSLREPYVNAPASVTSLKYLMTMDKGDLGRLTQTEGSKLGQIDPISLTESLP